MHHQTLNSLSFCLESMEFLKTVTFLNLMCVGIFLIFISVLLID